MGMNQTPASERVHISFFGKRNAGKSSVINAVMLYKQMNLKDKLPEMTEDEQLRLLATDGMLVKRPLVIGEDFVLTGFREKECPSPLMPDKMQELHVSEK